MQDDSERDVNVLGLQHSNQSVKPNGMLSSSVIFAVLLYPLRTLVSLSAPTCNVQARVQTLTLFICRWM
jgi:hypothetical protein